MARVDVAEATTLGTALDVPAHVDVTTVGVYGTPWAAPPARVDVTEVAVAGTPWAQPPPAPARIDVTEISVLAAPWAPPPPVVDVTEVLVLGSPWTPPDPGPSSWFGLVVRLDGQLVRARLVTRQGGVLIT